MQPLGNVFGLSPGDWTAIGTIALTVVAIAAFILNGRAGHHAKGECTGV